MLKFAQILVYKMAKKISQSKYTCLRNLTQYKKITKLQSTLRDIYCTFSSQT